jgi:hypothetical protein
VNVVLIDPSFSEDVLYSGGDDGIVRRWSLRNTASRPSTGWPDRPINDHEDKRVQDGEPRVIKQRVLLPHDKFEGAQRKGWRVSGVQLKPLLDLADFDHLTTEQVKDGNLQSCHLRTQYF